MCSTTYAAPQHESAVPGTVVLQHGRFKHSTCRQAFQVIQYTLSHDLCNLMNSLPTVHAAWQLGVTTFVASADIRSGAVPPGFWLHNPACHGRGLAGISHHESKRPRRHTANHHVCLWSSQSARRCNAQPPISPARSLLGANICTLHYSAPASRCWTLRRALSFPLSLSVEHALYIMYSCGCKLSRRPGRGSHALEISDLAS